MPLLLQLKLIMWPANDCWKLTTQRTCSLVLCASKQTGKQRHTDHLAFSADGNAIADTHKWHLLHQHLIQSHTVNVEWFPDRSCCTLVRVTGQASRLAYRLNWLLDSNRKSHRLAILFAATQCSSSNSKHCKVNGQCKVTHTEAQAQRKRLVSIWSIALKLSLDSQSISATGEATTRVECQERVQAESAVEESRRCQDMQCQHCQLSPGYALTWQAQWTKPAAAYAAYAASATLAPATLLIRCTISMLPLLMQARAWPMTPSSTALDVHSGGGKAFLNFGYLTQRQWRPLKLWIKVLWIKRKDKNRSINRFSRPKV